MSLCCRRCGKPFDENEQVCIVRCPPPGVQSRPRILVTGMILAIESRYHLRCVPPLWFHKFAGSFPVGQSLPAVVPEATRHVAGEGLSVKRTRKRLPRRLRKKRASQKHAALIAQQHADGEEWARTTTAADVIARGGKLGLCHCRTFSSSNGYFISEHGYCRYCGKWTPEAYRECLGEGALQAAIDELAIHDRVKLRELLVQ